MNSSPYLRIDAICAAIERRIDELIAQLPPLTDEDRRQATAILASVGPAIRTAA